MASNSPPSPWSDTLPPELLGLIIARVPLPADRARVRAVCRSWHSAVRQYASKQLPWIVHSDGTFVTLPDRFVHGRFVFPGDNETFLGATDCWLAFYRADAKDDDGWPARTYLLHNLFTGTDVPLPGLDSAIGKVSKYFEVRKVLLPDGGDLVAVTTNNWNYPLVLCRPGRSGAWLPERRAMPYARIIDVAFAGGSLYAITADEDLVMLELGEDDDGTPSVTRTMYVIGHPPAGGDDEQEEHGHEDVLGSDDDEATDLDEEDVDEDDEEVPVANYMNFMDEGDLEVPSGVNRVYPHGWDPVEPRDSIVTTRHLLESNGMVLMVRRQHHIFPYRPAYSRKVEVLEPDADAGEWVAADATELDTLFISEHYCKSASGHRKAGEEFRCYFHDQHDVSGPVIHFPFRPRMSTWVFPRDLVV